MSDKITRRMVESKFAAYLKATGQRGAKEYSDVGGLFLEYQKYYGFRVCKWDNESGGESHPLGSNSQNARTMYYMLDFAIRTAENTQS